MHVGMKWSPIHSGSETILKSFNFYRLKTDSNQLKLNSNLVQYHVENKRLCWDSHPDHLGCNTSVPTLEGWHHKSSSEVTRWPLQKSWWRIAQMVSCFFMEYATRFCQPILLTIIPKLAKDLEELSCKPIKMEATSNR